MKRYLGLIAFASIAACVAASHAPDGASCGSASECKSNHCVAGHCTHPGCRTNADCDPGWTCVIIPPDILSSGSSDCTPLCGHCPDNQHCSAIGVADRDACTRGAPRTMTFDVPATAVVGEEVALKVTLSPGPTLPNVAWYASADPGNPKSTYLGLSMGDTLSYAFHDLRGDLTLYAEAQDVNHVDSGEVDGVTHIHVDCVGAGKACSSFICCAPGLSCDFSGTLTCK